MQLIVHAQNLTVTAHLKEFFARKVKAIFIKTQEKIRKITINFTYQVGPKGVKNILCKVQVVLFGLPSILAVCKHENMHKASAAALCSAQKILEKRFPQS
jgi:ribosome-associated translation inhibitor RaiA